MDYQNITRATLNVIKECNIHSFPIDCFSILNSYGIESRSYSSLDDNLRGYCKEYSDDAFLYKGMIYYNDNMPCGRIKFSLAHELGHIVLQHNLYPSAEMEQEANYFASNMLAPRMVIHYAGCKNQNDVAKLFGLTNEAAQYAFDDYKRWYRWTIFHKMNAIDKAMYTHFYNQYKKCFVYKIASCAFCNTLLYNTNSILCNKCNTPKYSYKSLQKPDPDLLVAENQWLYDGI